MTSLRRNRKPVFPFGHGWPLLIWLVFFNACWAETVTLHLRNGDRVTGEMIAMDVDSVTITNSLLGRIVVPVAQVERLERKPAAGPSVTAQPTNAPPSPPPGATNPPPAQPAQPATAQKPAAAAAKPSAGPPPIKPKPPKHWNLNAQLGLDLQYNQTERQLYYGRSKWTYGKDRFRGIVDYLGNYGKNDGVLSANDMTGSVRAELAEAILFRRHQQRL